MAMLEVFAGSAVLSADTLSLSVSSSNFSSLSRTGWGRGGERGGGGGGRRREGGRGGEGE